MNEKSGLKPFKARVAAANVRVVARAVRSTAEPAPKVSVRDYGATEDMLFADVEEYLVESGWDFEGQLGGRQIATYRKGDKEVLVGRNDSFADRPQVIAQIIGIVAEVEKRSELDVYWDIRAARHGVRSLGFDVWPVRKDKPPESVTVEAPLPQFGGDRLTFYAVAEGDEGKAPVWILTDNSHVIQGALKGRGLSGFQQGLVDIALRDVEPLVPEVGRIGDEITMWVETDDLGIGIVLFSQLCAQVALICQTGEEIDD